MVTPESTSPPLCEYETARHENIKRNGGVLVELGMIKESDALIQRCTGGTGLGTKRPRLSAPKVSALLSNGGIQTAFSARVNALEYLSFQLRFEAEYYLLKNGCPLHELKDELEHGRRFPNFRVEALKESGEAAAQMTQGDVLIGLETRRWQAAFAHGTKKTYTFSGEISASERGFEFRLRLPKAYSTESMKRAHRE